MRKITMFTLALCICFIWVLPVGAVNYSDIDNHWAQQDITCLSARGLVSGKTSGQFAPEQVLTRQEAITMLVRLNGPGTGIYHAEGLASSGKGVSPWAVSYLDSALQKGIINESELRAVDWGAPATRVEMAVWLSKTLQLTPVVNDSEGIMGIFKDVGVIYPYQVPYVIPVVKNGLMMGSNGYFRPLDSLKRSEAAVLINRADARFPQAGGIKMERGQVVRIDRSYHVAVVVRDTVGLERSLLVTQQTVFYRSGKKIMYGNLPTGQWLNYIVNGSQLVYAECSGATEAPPVYTLPALPTSISVVGELEELNQSAGLVRVYSGGTQLSYRLGTTLTTGYINAKAGDEVALTIINGWVTGIVVVTIVDEDNNSIDNTGSGDYILYKATLDEADASDDEISLTSVYRLEDGRWRSRSNLQMNVKRNSDIYYEGEEIDLEDLEEDHDGETVYVVYDEDREEGLQIRVRDGSEYVWNDVVARTSSSSFNLEDEEEKVYYDDSTIVIHDNRLVNGSYIDEDDEIVVVVNRDGSTYRAAVVIID